MTSPHRIALWLLQLLLIIGLAGCVSDDDNNGNDNGTTGSERISHPAGQASRTRVPERADLISNWEKDRLAFTADAEGTIYLVDAANNRVIYSGPLRRGDEFVVNSRLNRATLNGKSVYDTPDSARRNYRVYFDRQR